jgi:hypothetical protein
MSIRVETVFCTKRLSSGEKKRYGSYGPYLYLYKMVRGRRFKKYIGKVGELTPEKIEEKKRKFLEEILKSS